MERQEDPGTGESRPRPDEEAHTAAFRDLMSKFPTGVSVVTAVDTKGAPQGATCSSLSSVTLSPPTLLVCLRTGGVTLEAVRETGRFAVNLLHEDAERAAKVFAAPFVDRFAEVPWQTWLPSGLPHLHRDAFACADCRVAAELLIGDHVIVVGTVSHITMSGGMPLMYGMRRFLSWAAPDALGHERLPCTGQQADGVAVRAGLAVPDGD
ncbi:flavin reductase family protein [Streptomyces sp. MP131-18]|uniref:flavin reductase family protein n=1 Tax=Streptomyces sp. MP131-18 TaxID=1857892 RepID=UPI00097C8B0A|nr:flavin reductase family protein [Streptomyces sp. MP131-18]ONK16173.1 Flavin reductase (NADPH) [Streptomyces sp. MP131-18]